MGETDGRWMRGRAIDLCVWNKRERDSCSSCNLVFVMISMSWLKKKLKDMGLFRRKVQYAPIPVVKAAIQVISLTTHDKIIWVSEAEPHAS